VIGASDVTCVDGTLSVVEARATVDGMIVRARSTAPVPNAAIAILRDFIVPLRKSLP
jgi:hypothetical protein